MNIAVLRCLDGHEEIIGRIKAEENKGSFDIVGSFCEDGEDLHCSGSCLPMSELLSVSFDYLIITSDIGFSREIKKLEKLGVESEKIIKGSVFLMEDFDFCEYIKLKESKLSIISNNCWGGITYQRLGFQYSSPFINVYESDDDYIKLLSDLKSYINKSPEFDYWEEDHVLKRKYPVLRIDDIQIYCNHDIFIEEAEKKWEERSKRVNFDNLFVSMYTSNPEILEKFDKLDFQNKMCFVPFETDIKSAYIIDKVDNNPVEKVNFSTVMNSIARGKYNIYNIFKILKSSKQEFNYR